MRLALFGATGAVGGECLRRALDAGHSVTAVARNPAKLEVDLTDAITVIEGNALDRAVVDRAITADTDAVLFAIGVDKRSPEDLCTDITRHILARMRELGRGRLIWCGGGSTLVPEDQVTLGARFVVKFSEWFLKLRHFDKEHQYELLDQNRDIEWIGVRPLQMFAGPHTGTYRVGFDRFSGMSKISFADCADAMLSMLDDDNWLGKAPIIQY